MAEFPESASNIIHLKFKNKKKAKFGFLGNPSKTTRGLAPVVKIKNVTDEPDFDDFPIGIRENHNRPVYRFLCFNRLYQEVISAVSVLKYEWVEF